MWPPAPQAHAPPRPRVQLPPGSSIQEVSRQFKKLALMYHPDKNVEDDGKRFKKFNYAKCVLTDPERKAEYDRCVCGAARQGPRRPGEWGLVWRWRAGTNG